MATLTREKASVVYYYKVCLVGDSCVGKTSFMLRVRNGKFTECPRNHSIADTHRLVRRINNKEIGLCLNDPGRTNGDQGTHTSNFYRNAACVLFFFDVTDKYTLESLPDMIQEASIFNEDRPCYFVLVGTKNDVGTNDMYLSEIVDQKKDAYDLKEVFFISSKTGEGIDQLLDHVAEEIGKLAVGNEERIQLEVNAVSNGESKCCKN